MAWQVLIVAVLAQAYTSVWACGIPSQSTNVLSGVNRFARMLRYPLSLPSLTLARQHIGCSYSTYQPSVRYTMRHAA